MKRHQRDRFLMAKKDKVNTQWLEEVKGANVMSTQKRGRTLPMKAVREKEKAMSILKEDKENYMGLIYLGLSLQDLGPVEQAPKAFQKAAKVDPKNPLAWNGLRKFYEEIDTSEGGKRELCNSYCALIELETEFENVKLLCKKLESVCKFGDTERMVKILHAKLKECPTFGFIKPIILKIFLSNDLVNSETANIYQEILKDFLKNSDNADFNEIPISEIIPSLYQQNKMKYIEPNLTLNDSVMDNVYFYLCKLYIKKYIEDEDFEFCKNIPKDDLKTYVNFLFTLQSKNSIALIVESVLLIEEQNWDQAKQKLEKVVKFDETSEYAWILLTYVNLKLSLNEEATKSANYARKFKNVEEKANKYYVEALVNSNSLNYLEEVVKIFNLLPEEKKLKILPFVIEAHLKLENISKAKILLLELEKIPEYDKNTLILLKSKILYTEGKNQESLNLLLKNETETSKFWIEVGLLYEKIGQSEKSLPAFLKAAKLDPNNFAPFLHLGHFYKKNNNLDKARRCYEKSHKLNPYLLECISELSTVYRALNFTDANIALLEKLVKGVIKKENSWAWLQLGLQFFEKRDYVKAIDHLRLVLRIDPTNVHCWEALADSYFERGAFTSALKSYEKILEISKDSIYAVLQIATIKFTLGQFSEARTDFEDLVLKDKNSVVAFKGLAETCLRQAKKCYEEQRLGTARDHAQYAIDILTKALKIRVDISSLWKLFGDTCAFVSTLPLKYCCLLVQNAILEGNIKDDSKKIIELDDLYNLSKKCYSKAISLVEDNILIWHDLATCYLSHALRTEEKCDVADLFTRAQAAAEYCTLNNPIYWQHWNLLGNVAMLKEPPNYSLAQHSFIMALSIDKNSAVAWSNLGILYLRNNDIKLANEAFAQAQRSDPNYTNSWIGQALLAEFIGNSESMDLFRHSTQLGPNQQGALGYAQWVCKTLLESEENCKIYAIKNMHAVPIACDAITWYTEKNPNNACAWNMLGILKERMGLKKESKNAFKNAYRLCDKKNRDKSRINYGRLLTETGDHKTAIQMFQDVEGATFESGIGLALALFRDKQYEDSYSAYESALHWLTENKTLQSDLLTALASMAYMFQGAEPAKVLLFQSIQLTPPSPWGLYATLSLGLLHQDVNLASLVLQELAPLKDDMGCFAHYCTLLSYFYLLQKNYKRAVIEISKLIHRHPNVASGWLRLATILLSIPKKCFLASKYAEIVLKLKDSTMDLSKVMCLVSSASIASKDYKKALISAQKAIYSNPSLPVGWSALLTALKYQENEKYSKNTKNILKYVENTEKSNALQDWIMKNRTILAN